MVSRTAKAHPRGNKFTPRPRVSPSAPRETQRYFNKTQEVLPRIQRWGLTYTFKSARLCPSNRTTVIATYRLEGQ